MRLRYLGLQPYLCTWQQMKSFTDSRTAATVDEIWFVEHEPVYTQGQAGKAEHLLESSDIPVVASDRGGQITYHGPGQLIAYVLIDLKRCKIGIRELVTRLENAAISCLAEFKITAQAREKSPGVYVEDAKIASLGLRVRRGCSYHGIALNVNLDLSPFKRINPCGYAGMKMTQISDFVKDVNIEQVTAKLEKALLQKFAC